MKATAAQTCRRLDSNHPYDLIVDDLGNQVLHFTFRELPPFSTKLVRIETDVEMLAASRTIQVTEHSDFLRAEKHIESNSPEVLGLPKQLKG